MKIIKTTFGILLTPVILLFIFIGLMNFLSAPDASGLFGFKGYIVTSGSMEPTFSPGDYIIVKSDDFSTLEPEEVITFMEEDTIVTHRIKSLSADGVQTQGDANTITDAKTVVADDYIGTLQGIIPAFGQIILFMQKPFVFPVLVFLVGAYIISIYYSDNEEEAETTTEN